MQHKQNRRWLFFILLSACIHFTLLLSLTPVIGIQTQAQHTAPKWLSVQLATSLYGSKDKSRKRAINTPMPLAQTSRQIQPKPPAPKSNSVKRQKSKQLISSQFDVAQKPVHLGMAGSPAEQRIKEYEKRLLAHLQKHLNAPEISGELRLEIRIEYSQIATHVKVLKSDNTALNAWALKAVYAANPLPAMPDDVAEPYFFRPSVRVLKPK